MTFQTETSNIYELIYEPNKPVVWEGEWEGEGEGGGENGWKEV